MSAPEPVFYVRRRVGMTSSGGLTHAVYRQHVAVCGYALTPSALLAEPTRPRPIDCSLCRAKLLEGVPVYAVGAEA